MKICVCMRADLNSEKKKEKKKQLKRKKDVQTQALAERVACGKWSNV